MAELIKMPRLSDTMEEGTVASWLKKVGDKVEEGDILAEIETDKATMEFESFYEGTLLYIGVQVGETTNVDDPLAIIGQPDEDYTSLLSSLNDSSVNVEEKKENTNKVEEIKKDTVTDNNSIPDGVTVVTMPRLSDTMEEGTVATWLKKVGDNVDEGDILAEIETDKATMEFESFQSGFLLYIGLEVGDSAKVDDLLAIIGPKGVSVTHLVDNFGKNNSPVDKIEEPVLKAVETKQITESSPIVVENKEAVNNKRLFISPLAKKLALEKNININTISGSGENGRIIKIDIENYKTGTPSSVILDLNESFEEVNHSQMRKTIAKRLGQSKFSAPHYYLSVEFDMSNAISFRNQYNSIPDTKISFNDIIVKATSMALSISPSVNSQWFEDRVRYNKHVHVGVAVGVEDGLVVPVLKFANQLNLSEIGGKVKDFAIKAKSKKLTPQEMEGSTFTISNLGMFDIESFTSIINLPNSAILSVGSIIEKPVVKNGNIVVGNTMKLTLACDHRVIDGLTGAKFLQTLRGFVENPVTMLA
ncbi:MAG: Dihydrolipoyllysine-residue acetyltransferase component of pyruvate dehydrogenase complex [Flavobacteriaceae bacterium]|nr:MAG: Dihydrolipoyllysine-residue acetyltransferase component of pyruvate dehydrogenase complex [Flavobacteriaceae bacterium]|tara:strand:- start:1550 stop:3145 length:1596 start_codon:yes stop_codon:yes gene_type:complete